MSKLLLTFDVEDFINEQSLKSLNVILKLLAKYHTRAIFFVTGHMAEKLKAYPKTQQLLQDHEIGFHSSAHSVHPTIFEYCDVEKYDEAYRSSLKRETSHINPLSGEIEGPGGIKALRALFPNKNIIAYRAPGFCCPPPLLEAMATLGLKFDFSLNSFVNVPVVFKNMVFYPRPIFSNCEKALLLEGQKITCWFKLLRSILKPCVNVLNFHPDSFANQVHWDSFYHQGNPRKLQAASTRPSSECRGMFGNLENLLNVLNHLKRLRIITTFPSLGFSERRLDAHKLDLSKLTGDITFWARAFFAYEPKYTFSQLCKFLNITNMQECYV
jgi:hypothetical protein